MFGRRHPGQGERLRPLVTHPCRTRRRTTPSRSPAADTPSNLAPTRDSTASSRRFRARSHSFATAEPSPARPERRAAPRRQRCPGSSDQGVTTQTEAPLACHTHAHTPGCPAVDHGHSRTLQSRDRDRRSRRSDRMPRARTSKLAMRVRFPSSALIASWLFSRIIR
jgi:hypothetical protein